MPAGEGKRSPLQELCHALEPMVSMHGLQIAGAGLSCCSHLHTSQPQSGHQIPGVQLSGHWQTPEA